MNKNMVAAAAAAAVVVLGGAGYYYWQSTRPVAEPEAQVAQAPAAAPAPASASTPDERLPQYPVEAAASQAASGPVDVDAAIRSAVASLVGKRDAASFLQPEDFIHRVVATVDNLPRKHASPSLWPVQPVPGRFTVDAASAPAQAPAASAGAGADAAPIAAANAARYASIVAFIGSIDTPRAVDLYFRFYPSFQRAYQELGYPHGYFNDRLVEVIDHLMAAPEPATAPRVHLVDVNGPVKPVRPWVNYEFTDPALQSLSAGQKMMVRVGLDNERRLKAKLAELRAAVTRGASR